MQLIERILGVIYWASSHILLAEGAGVAAQTIFTLRFSLVRYILAYYFVLLDSPHGPAIFCLLSS